MQTNTKISNSKPRKERTTWTIIFRDPVIMPIHKRLSEMKYDNNTAIQYIAADIFEMFFRMFDKLGSIEAVETFINTELENYLPPSEPPENLTCMRHTKQLPEFLYSSIEKLHD